MLLFLIISSTVLAKQGQLKNYEITTFKIYERKEKNKSKIMLKCLILTKERS